MREGSIPLRITKKSSLTCCVNVKDVKKHYFK